MSPDLAKPRVDVTGTLRSAPLVSVIIPLGSRRDDLRDICRELRGVLLPLVPSFEVLLVGVGGPETMEQVRDITSSFPEARFVRLARSLSESTTLALGAQRARGELLIMLDPYLHVAVADLPKLLLPLMTESYDLVCARRFPRLEHGLGRLASEGFNAIARWLSGVEVHDLTCRTRAMRTTLLRDMPLYGDLHRFLPIFAERRGYRWREVNVPQQPRKREIGAFRLRSYLKGALDLMVLVFLTRFLKRPLHFFGPVGVLAVLAGFGLSGYLAYLKLALHQGIGHRPLLLLAVLLIVVGVQVASIGLLGEIMIFTHASDLKEYLVEEERGGEPA